MGSVLKHRTQSSCDAANTLPCDRFEGPHEEYIERFLSTYELVPLSAPNNVGRNILTNWYADGCVFTYRQSDAASIRKTKALLQNNAGYVFVRRFKSGTSWATMAEHGFVLEPGRLYLTDEAHLADSVKLADTMEGLFVPKSMIGYQSGTHAPFMDLSKRAILTSALHREFDLIFAQLHQNDCLDRVALARLVACLKTTIQSPDQDGDVRRQARAAMADVIRVHIERHLESPDLSVDWVLKQFGVSRASLYRMFEADGGVRQFISDRRLYRAVMDLTERPILRGDIAAASEKWGFSSAKNFNRAVRRTFGVAPGTLVNTPLKAVI